jgi:uncharacterized membrane protein
VTFYDSIVALHVLAVVVGFGALFVLPVLGTLLRARQPEAVPAFYRATGTLGSRVLTPAWVVVLLAGVYLASDRDLWSEVWVTVPMTLLIVIFGLAGAVLAPAERKLVASAERDVEAGGTASAETEGLVRRVHGVEALMALLVAVAIFFMVTKAGA